MVKVGDILKSPNYSTPMQVIDIQNKNSKKKVLIKLLGAKNADGSRKTFKLDDPSTWSRTDQLIIYEYYHFASNNTFGDYTIQDLVNGIELDACQIVYRKFYK